MACTLSVRGKTFDVDAFLVQSTLRPVGVWHRGDVVSPTAKGGEAGRKHESSGLAVVVSECGRGDYQGQLKDAKRFLRRHQAELRRLRACRGVTDAWLDFGVVLETDALHVDYFPADIIQLAGDIPLSLTITHYLV